MYASEGKQSRAELTMCAQKTPIGYNYSLEPVRWRPGASASFLSVNAFGRPPPFPRPQVRPIPIHILGNNGARRQHMPGHLWGRFLERAGPPIIAHGEPGARCS